MTRKVILNLGAGNKYYRGQDANTLAINVDAVKADPEKLKKKVLDIDLIDKEFCEGFTPTDGEVIYHESDIAKLKFIEDSIADEAHGFHVIEHFYVYDVPEILKEWLRVLKPGGILVLEQPNVLKCAINLLQASTLKDEKMWYSYGLLGFYGKQDPKEPLMAHKYGYFPDLLGKLMRDAGFEMVRQEKATTHAGEARDFRMVGRRPL